jgi:hypothetical protein
VIAGVKGYLDLPMLTLGLAKQSVVVANTSRIIHGVINEVEVQFKIPCGQ